MKLFPENRPLSPMEAGLVALAIVAGTLIILVCCIGGLLDPATPPAVPVPLPSTSTF